jgi:phage host-nuclease inhibitor protein Gam
LYFAVTEGGQNDWLEMLAVDVTHGTVRVRLKRPVVRIRQVGVEVVMSFRMHGAVNSP